MKKFFLFIYFLISLSALWSQINYRGIPFVKNYTVDIYNAEPQNWAVLSDNRGIIYIANNFCVLEYDGINWTKIKVPNDLTIRSLAVDTMGTVFAGGYNEIGYLKPDSVGQLKYVSLVDKIDTAFRNFDEVWKIYATKDAVYFSGNYFMLKYDYDTITIVNPYKKQGNLFYFYENNKFFLGNFIDGLIIFQNNLGNKFLNSDFFAEKYITGFFAINKNEYVVATYMSGIYKITEAGIDSLQKFIPNYTNDFLKSALIANATLIDDNVYAFSTNNNGIVFTDSNFNIISNVSEKEKLQDITAYYSFVKDKSAPVWVALNNGVSKVEINSPFRFFDNSFGYEGSVWEIQKFNGKLFVATNLGLYFLDYQDNMPVFRKVKFDNANTNLEVWSLLKFDYNGKERMLAGTNFGVFEIDKFNAKLIPINGSKSENNSSTQILYLSKYKENKIYAGVNKYFKIYTITDNQLLLDTMIKLDKEIRSIAEDSQGNIWLGSHFSGVVKVDKDFNVYNYGEDKGLPVLKDPVINVYFGDMIISTPKGLYTYDADADSIVEYQKFGQEFSNCLVYQSVSKGNKIWFNVLKNNIETIKQVNVDGENFTIDSVPFKRVSFKNIQALYVDENDILWIGTPKFLYSFDLKQQKSYNQDYKTLLRKVYLNNDSLIFGGTFYSQDNGHIILSEQQTDNFFRQIAFKDNTMTFEWTATFFEDEQATEYSFMLENFDKEWSKWAKETKYVYTNIPEGDYTFKVKAKNVYGQEGSVAEFSFTVLPPWYRTVWAYIFYVLFGVLVILLVVKWYTRKLKRENIRLERIVAERTKEIRQKNVELEQQKEEIEAQRDEIEAQRDILSEKNKMIEAQNESIKSSITYASRIQEAILPDFSILVENFSETFVLFKPRDIVSGDFYWFRKENDRIFVVAADCTGHGVPGAFMSMLGVSLLNEIIDKNPDIQVEDVLNTLRDRVIKSLHQREDRTDSKDGMDLAMFIFDKKQNIVEFSGANNPLVLIRPKNIDIQEIIEQNGEKRLRISEENPDVHIVEFKADKMPVGIYFREKEFTKLTFKPQQGDIIYMFSDGYPDQFGGEAGRKFMLKSLKLMFANLYKQPLSEQKNILNSTIEDWIDNIDKNGKPFRQTDDILVIGVKIY